MLNTDIWGIFVSVLYQAVISFRSLNIIFIYLFIYLFIYYLFINIY